MNSCLYHGGSARAGFSSKGSGGGTSTDGFTLIYDNMSSNLGSGDFLRSPDFALRMNGALGFHFDNAYSIVNVSWCIQSFQSNTSTESLMLRLRSFDSTGLKTSAFSTGEGNLVGTTVNERVPDSGGVYQYYYGYSESVNWSVLANQTLFVYIFFSDIDVIDGITCWLECEK